jgi:hypothetical protein
MDGCIEGDACMNPIGDHMEFSVLVKRGGKLGSDMLYAICDGGAILCCKIGNFGLPEALMIMDT